MTATQKIKLVHDNPKTRKPWNDLTKQQRLFVLAGLEIGVDEKWTLSLIEEAKETEFHPFRNGRGQATPVTTDADGFLR